MEEMKFDGPIDPIVLPDIANYRGKNVLAEYIRFAEAVRMR